MRQWVPVLVVALVAGACSVSEQLRVDGETLEGVANRIDLLGDAETLDLVDVSASDSPALADGAVLADALCPDPFLAVVNAQLDGQSEAISLPAGATVPLSFTWYLSNGSSDPGFAGQIVLHFNDSSGGTICFVVGASPQCPLSQSDEFLGTLLLPDADGQVELIATLQPANACLLPPNVAISGVASVPIAALTLSKGGADNQLPMVSSLTVTPHRPGTMLVAAKVSDADLDPVSLQCSFANGGGEFLPCTLHPGATVTGTMAEAGEAKIEFEWLAQKDLGKYTSHDVVIRITPEDSSGPGASVESEPFDFEGPEFAFLDGTEALLPPLLGDSRGVAIGDVDGDLDLDIVVSLAHETNILLRNQGSDPFVPEELPGGSFESQPGALLDVDSDGDLDLFVPNVNAPSRMLINDGTGHFEDATLQWLGEDFAFQIERALSADVDGDLDPDLVLLCSGSQPERLLRNDKDSFTDITATALPADTSMAAGGSLGTIDNVGGPDLVFNSFISNQTLALWTNSQGIFSDASHRIKTPYEAMGFDAILVDLNQDGYQDIIEVNMMNVQRVLLNDQQGYFSAMAGAFPSDIGTWGDGVVMAVDGASGDLNLDGIPDLVLGCSGQTPGNNANLLFLGTGMGGFTEFSEGFPEDGGDTRLVSLFDVDLDGDLDVFVVNALNQSRLYINE